MRAGKNRFAVLSNGPYNEIINRCNSGLRELHDIAIFPVICMIIKTEAIALNIRPYSESSQIVGWLTPDHGRIATIVKGAQRPRNIFLGQYDLFYTCELVFYLRQFQGLHIVKECFPLKHRGAFRTYWPGTACASYFCGLAAKITPMYAPQPNLYKLLEAALDFFSSARRPPGRPGRERPALEAGLYWFELKLLGALGLAPRLDACLQCHQPLAPEAISRPVSFSTARGGVICARCSGQAKAAGGGIAPDSLALLRFWQASQNAAAALNVVCSERQAGEIGAILGNLLRHHLETEITGREIALAIQKLSRSTAFDKERSRD